MHKSAGIIIKDKSLLVLRSEGKDTFFAPGGKLDCNETTEMALYRELNEEISIELQNSDITFFGCFTAPASGNEDILLTMDVFHVHSYRGEITASNEIAEYKWVNSSNIDSVKISTIFRDKVFPQLLLSDLVL